MRSLVILTLVGLMNGALLAQRGDAEGPKYTDPKKTDKDFPVQGEYVGVIKREQGEEKFGVQIIALGQGKFRGVGYHGGLPGDGWNGEERILRDGRRQSDGSVTFRHDNGVGIVKDGVLTVQTDDGAKLGQFKRIVRKSKTLGQMPPENAVVLFDGKTADNWKKGRLTTEGLLMEGATSKQTFGSHRLHIEFRLPYQPEDVDQARGNSGVYLQGRYEVQMLDSFGLEGKHNECGGIYSVKDPDINMCYPPLSWQTYDIEYTAAKYDENGKLKSNPRITVRHNGVLIHNNVELPGDRATTAAPLKPGSDPGPVFLQDHRCPVRYRNIWVVRK